MWKLSLISLVLFGACSTPELARVDARQLPALRTKAPVAALFSIPGCRYCKIAERGFQAASRNFRKRVIFRKVMVDADNLDHLKKTYGLGPNMPQARLLFQDGRWKRLPLTREGPIVATAIRRALAPVIRKTTYVP